MLSQFSSLQDCWETYFPKRFDLESSEAEVKGSLAPALERWKQGISTEETPLARDGKMMEVALLVAPSRGWHYPSGSEKEIKSLPKATQLHKKADPALLSCNPLHVAFYAFRHFSISHPTCDCFHSQLLKHRILWLAREPICSTCQLLTHT